MKVSVLMAFLLSTHAFGYSVVDSMYESPVTENFQSRIPASQTGYCLLNPEQKLFAGACYSSLDLCNKRLEFWRDLPGIEYHSCIKL